jgi:hypothetical protein
MSVFDVQQEATGLACTGPSNLQLTKIPQDFLWSLTYVPGPLKYTIAGHVATSSNGEQQKLSHT